MKDKIIHAKSQEFLATLPSESIDGVITSPPYDDLRTYTNPDKQSTWNWTTFTQIAQQLTRTLKQGGFIAWVTSDQTIDQNKSLSSYRQAIYFQEQLHLKVYDVIIYEKTASAPPHSRRYSNTFEYIFIFSKGNLKTIHLIKDKINRWAGTTSWGARHIRQRDGTLQPRPIIYTQPKGTRTNIWRYKNNRGFATQDKEAYEHPAIFPEALVHDLLISFSEPNDLILDPFGGSGTTAKVSKELNRHYLYVDEIKQYTEIAKKRLDQLDWHLPSADESAILKE